MLQTMRNERGADHRGESQASAGWQGVDLDFNGRVAPGRGHGAADYALTSQGTEANPIRHKVGRCTPDLRQQQPGTDFSAEALCQLQVDPCDLIPRWDAPHEPMQMRQL